ncbi:GAF domain-containing protein [Alkalicoccobacillus porphyridii]|nr:GAF domain-containing protein [Alkalicoccobacillus porphyridii]
MSSVSTTKLKKIEIRSFTDFDEVATQVLVLLSHHLSVNTLFIARNDLITNEIAKVINKDRLLLQEGQEVEYNETFCRLSVDHGSQVLVIPRISKDSLARDLQAAESFGNGSFIGVPIYNACGQVYGTICGIDDQEVEFSDNDIELIGTMASLLSHVLELNNAYRQVTDLAAPLVPIADGIGVLPVVGDMTLKRMETIADTVMLKCSQLELHYLLIDVSGILRIDEAIGDQFLQINEMLRLIGVTPFFTGIRPDLAMKMNQLSKSMTKLKTFGTMAQALASIGFTAPNFNA